MSDDVDKFLSESQQMESRRQELIRDLLKQKEAAIKAFDEKLARLGHNAAPTRRNHHKPPKPDTKAQEARPTGKPPATS